MDDDVFSHHVNSEKNDFKSWVNTIIKDRQLAETLGNMIKKNEILHSIDSRIEKLREKKERDRLAPKLKKSSISKKVSKPSQKEVEKSFKKKKVEVIKPMSKDEWVANKMVDLSFEVSKKFNEIEGTRKEFENKTALVAGINDFFIGLVVGLVLGVVLARILI